MKLIIGLGNPGEKYAKTRHNIGYRALDILAPHARWRESKKFRTLIAPTSLAGKKVLLVKPQTFMNRSGEAIKHLVDFFKIPAKDILIIYDDIDLFCGTLRLREKGGSAGHNGLASIIEALGTENLSRLKIGIAEEKPGKQSIPSEDYVLRKATPLGESKIKQSLAQIPEIVLSWLA